MLTILTNDLLAYPTHGVWSHTKYISMKVYQATVNAYGIIFKDG